MKRRDFNKNLIGLAALLGISPQAVLAQTDKKEDYNLIIKSVNNEVKINCVDLNVDIESGYVEVQTLDNIGYTERVPLQRSVSISAQGIISKQYQPIICNMCHGAHRLQIQFISGNKKYNCTGFINMFGYDIHNHIELDISVSGLLNHKGG